MAFIRKRRSWTSQPQEVVAVDAGSVQARGLLRLWPLGVSPREINGVDNSAPVGVKFSPSDRGLSADFVGAGSQYLNIPSSTIAIGNDFAFSFWIRGSDLETTRQTIWGCNDAVNNFSLEVGTNPSEVPSPTRCITAIVTGEFRVNSPSYALTDGVWSHVVFVKRGAGTNKSEIYVDGVSVTLNRLNDKDYSDSATEHYIGRRKAASQYFTGSLQDFRIYSPAPSPDVIKQIYENPWQLFAPQSIWVPVSAGGGGAQVTSDASSSYSIIGAVTADSAAASYAIQGTVTQDATATYAVQASAQSDAASAYSIIGAVAADSASAAYAIQGTVSQDATASYGIAGVVTSDATASYDILTASGVASSASASYSIIGTVDSDATAAYSVRGSAQADATASYDLIGWVQSDASAAWSIAAPGVASDAVAAYSVIGSVISDALAAYVVADDAPAVLGSMAGSIRRTGAGRPASRSTAGRLPATSTYRR